jgi:hypothetical protein
MTLTEPSISAKKTLTCTLATASWVTDGSTIPATESTRWGRTLTAEDFPTWSFQPESVKYIGHIFVSVYNNSGSSQTISWKMYKNNSSINNGTTTSDTNTYKGLTFAFYDVTVGDVLEVAVWTATNTNITVQGSLYHVVPTRLLPTSKPCIEVGYTFGAYSYPSPLTSSNTISTTYEYIGNNISNTISSATTRTYSGLSFISQNNYNLFRYGMGDRLTSNAYIYDAHASNQIIRASYYPTTISYRELRL